MSINVASTSKENQPPKLRYASILISSFIIMLCAGSMYAWSVYVNPLKNQYGFTTTNTQIVFGFIVMLLAISNCFAGRIENRFGPRKTAMAGAIFFFVGYLIASISGGNIFIMIIGLGLLNGIGMALAYITILSVVNKWLPNNKGLATGIAMSGFGGGAILASYIAQPLLAGGMDVLAVFRTVGLILGIIYFLCALLLANPPWEIKTKASRAFNFDYSEIVKDRRFWVLTVVTLCAAIAPLLFYGNLKPLGISTGVSEWAAGLGISLMAIGNLVGRLVWGQIADTIGVRKSILIAILSVTAMTLAMWAFMNNDVTFIIFVLIFGFCFGSDFTLFATNVGEIWGVRLIGTIYPLIFLAYGTAAIIGPILGGKVFDVTGSYSIALLIGAIICFVAFLVYLVFMPKAVENNSNLVVEAKNS